MSEFQNQSASVELEPSAPTADREALTNLMSGNSGLEVTEVVAVVKKEAGAVAQPVVVQADETVSVMQPVEELASTDTQAQPVPAQAPYQKAQSQEQAAVVDAKPAETRNAVDVGVAMAMPQAKIQTVNKQRVKRDLSTIQIRSHSDVSAVDLQEAISAATARSAGGTFQCVALKSGYAFEVSALQFKAIERLLASSSSILAEQQKLIKTAYEQIKWFSCGKLSYEQFVAATAFSDLDTIYYAIYAATYPGNNSYPIPCQHCNKENTVQVSVNALVDVVNDDSLRRVREVLQRAFSNRSVIQDVMPLECADRIELDDAGAVVQYGIPSISDYLNGIERVTSTLIDQNTGRPTVGNEEVSAMVQCQLGVDAIYLPSVNDPNQFVEVQDPYYISNFITGLSKDDGRLLKSEQVELETKYQVAYAIPPFQCISCAKTNTSRQLDFERILFIRLNQEKAD